MAAPCFGATAARHRRFEWAREVPPRQASHAAKRRWIGGAGPTRRIGLAEPNTEEKHAPKPHRLVGAAILIVYVGETGALRRAPEVTREGQSSGTSVSRA
jgi:hypothetical protein